MAEREQDMFGYGTGYVPQIDKIVEHIEHHLPDVIFDFITNAVIKDAKAQGVNLNDIEDDDSQDMMMETVGDVSHEWVSRVREAAKSGDEDALHFMLLPF